ncbi:MAG TPA: DUF3426 domain-containing protein [candidate division Zixibacteria bacterium]|nr:DUF3426 domain-containing protein [candidate division Zixibacteria bacterium]
MIVRCPSCRTTYKVSDDVVKGTKPAFRCSRCKHTFELEAAELEKGEPQQPSLPEIPQPPAEPEDHELSFAFPPKESKSEAPPPGPVARERARPEQPPRASSPAGPAGDEQWSLPDVDTRPETPFTIAGEREGGVRKPEPAPAAPAEDVRYAPIPPLHERPDEQQASTGPYWTLFALLVILFAFLAAYHRSYPAAAESALKKIPLLGPALVRNHHLKNGVEIRSIRADYQTIQGNRDVFVISGMAVNYNPVVIRAMRVGGRVYDREGKEIEQQSMWVGNAISRKIIRGMTAQDIQDLQRLKPLKTFEIPPGDSVPFAIVFLKPSKEIASFSFEVIGAEGES